MKRAEQTLSDFLRKKKLTIAFAESITCGLLAHKIGCISETSIIFKGGIVCYDEEVKIKLLGIKENLIQKYSAESQMVTDSLATNLSKIIKADVHAAVTGLAAPGGTETKAKPVGTVFYSFLFRSKLHKLKKRFYGRPLKIKEKACNEYFKFITRQLKKYEYRETNK